MKKRRLAYLLLLPALLFQSCGESADPVSVQSVTMITGTYTTGRFDRFGGVVSARENIKVEKDSSLEVKEILVEEGSEVKTGDVLFTYDTDQLQLNLDKLKLEAEQMKVSAETQKKQLATLEKAEKSAPQSEKLSYTLQIQELQLNITEASYQLQAKEKEIAAAESKLTVTQVESPVDGVVQTISTTGSDSMGNPLPFISIAQSDELLIKGTINELNRDALTEGTQLLIRSRTDREMTWTGYVDSIDWNNPQSGSSYSNYYMPESEEDSPSSASQYTFFVALDYTDGLMLGQHVYIEPAVSGETGGILLSSCYISDADSSPWVWAENGKGKLEKRKVTLGEYSEELDAYPVSAGLTLDDYLAFPEDGLSEGLPTTRYSENDFENSDSYTYDNTDNVDILPLPEDADAIYGRMPEGDGVIAVGEAE